MKIRLERDVLAEAVQWAARSLPLRPSVPILAGLLVRADAESVTFSSFDYETSARISVPAMVAVPTTLSPLRTISFDTTPSIGATTDVFLKFS